MPSTSRFLLCCVVLILWGVPVSAQYMRLTTDNPADNTRLRTGVTNIVTITLDTNHDRNGVLQTCNSHTVSCGAPASTQPLNMFSYTLAYKAVGGTVQWGTFTPADAAYTPTIAQIQNNTEVEINMARTLGTVTNPGLSTLGTIPVTVQSGSPSIDIQVGAGALNPFGFGTGFGTFCDGYVYGNTYVRGDPSDPCGAISGVAGDWFDFDGVTSPPGGNMLPVIVAPATASATEGTPMSAVNATASDPDGANTLTITQAGMPGDLTFATDSPGPSPRTASVSGTPGLSDAGSYNIVWTVDDGSGGSATATTALTIGNSTSGPVVDPIADVQVCGGQVVSRAIRATDPDGDAIAFTLTGPPWVSFTSNLQVGTTRVGNLDFFPPTSVGGAFSVSLTATSGGLSDTKTFSVSVTCPPAFFANTPFNMTVPVSGAADQTVRASEQNGLPVTFTKVSGPTFVTVTTIDAGAGTATGSIHLAPGSGDAGTYTVTVRADNGTLGSQKSFTATVCGACGGSPALAPIANMTVQAGFTADQTLTATDPDGQALTFSNQVGPAFMQVSTTSPGTGTATGKIHLAPSTSQAGSYAGTVRVSDGVLSDFKDLSFTVTGPNQPPVMNPIPTPDITQGGCSPPTAARAISATDLDGDAITFTWTGPPWVSVVPNRQSGTTCTANLLLGQPTADGTFPGSVTATAGGQSNTKSFTVFATVAFAKPVMPQPADMSVAAQHVADQSLTATMPCSQQISFVKVTGPEFMSVTTLNPGGGTATGNIRLQPSASDVGTYAAEIMAAAGNDVQSDHKLVLITVRPNVAPTLNPIANMTVAEGMTADQGISATDPDGNPVTFAKGSGPLFMSVSTSDPGHGTATGNIHLAPGPGSSGGYVGAVSATNGTLSASKSFLITVFSSGNRCPIANAGGPYSGLTGIPVSLDGSASSDPDGNTLTYAWDFDASDGITVDATGVSISHVFAITGTFTVTLSVTDNGDGDPSAVCSASATTTASIQAACDAAVFNGYDTIRLNSGKPTWFAYVQPTDECYSNSDVAVSSFLLKYGGHQISASGKTGVGGDKNGDGIAEIKANFLKDDLRTLFSGTGLGNGHNIVIVTLEANLVTGGALRGTTQLDVVNNGDFTSATVSPNPLNPDATLTFTTSRPGAVRVDLFNIQGRLVRRLVDDPAMAAGIHEATIDGRGAHGEKLPSGVYYIRGTSTEGEFKQLITILK